MKICKRILKKYERSVKDQPTSHPMRKKDTSKFFHVPDLLIALRYRCRYAFHRSNYPSKASHYEKNLEILAFYAFPPAGYTCKNDTKKRHKKVTPMCATQKNFGVSLKGGGVRLENISGSLS
jgi:hypothetical protein